MSVIIPVFALFVKGFIKGAQKLDTLDYTDFEDRLHRLKTRITRIFKEVNNLACYQVEITTFFESNWAQFTLIRAIVGGQALPAGVK